MSGSTNATLTPTQRDAFVKRYGVTPAKADHKTLARMIEDMMKEGLHTTVTSFPENDGAFALIVDQIRKLSADDLREKLVISGWLLEPYGSDEMRCQECMYYLVNRRWCDLPELNLPAEPDWWCRLWRI